ncbi:hypothetical protein KAJ27_12390 [bacterium]|nr:hypothetical protein [bacterium]
MVNRKRGFAYLLLLIFLVTLAILALEIQPMISKDIIREREETFFHILRDYSIAISKFKSYYGRYPASLSDLAVAPPAPRFIRKFQRDPFMLQEKKSDLVWDVIKKTGKHGGITSVRSKSEKLSLGGIKYKNYYYDESGVLKQIDSK